MKKKKLTFLSYTLCACFLINSIVLPKNVQAEITVPSNSSNMNTTIEDYTELYGLSKNEEIMPLTLKKQYKVDDSISFAPSSPTRDIKYLAVLIEFPDADMEKIHLDDENALKAGQMIAKDGGKVISSDGEKDILSVNEYFKKYSYGKLNVDVDYFPKNNENKVVSYESKRPRTYYMRQSATNPNGFTDANRVEREIELFNEVAAAIKSNIESTYNAGELDTNGDGYVDAINFFVESDFLDTKITRGDILWSHKIDTILNTKSHGLNIGQYNVINAGDPSSPGGVFSYEKSTSSTDELKLNRATYSVIIHEFLHTLGIYDLYRVSGGDPVGIFDIMGYNHPTNPQPVLTVHSRGALNWGEDIPTFKANEEVKIYRPKYKDDTEKTSYKILSKLNADEYFVVEYYDKPEGIANSGREDGLIVYRVNSKLYNNLEGSVNSPEKDFVFVFRPNETQLGEANSDNLKDAVISPTVGKKYGKPLESTGNNWDKDSIYFSNGANSGIELEIVEVTDDYISVRYNEPVVTGTGTAEDPYLISNPSEWNNYVNSNNYVKLTQNIDFTGSGIVTKDIIKAHIDGNGKTISNITIENGSGLFESLTDTTVKNLTISNITVKGADEGHAGALTGSLNSGEIDNVHILSGSVTGGNPSSYTLQGVGGFVGTIAYGTIKNSSAKVNVSNGQHIGAFIGLSQGGTVQNNSASGIVTSKSNEKAGGFYGDSLKFSTMPEQDSTYIDNLFEITNENLKKASSAGNKDGIYGIYMQPKVSINLDVKDTESLLVQLSGTKQISLSFKDFKVQNSSIATLSGNDIKGLMVGNTTFTTSLSLGNAKLNFTRPIEVTGTIKPVETPVNNPLISISLNKDNVDLNVGETSNIVVSYNPSNTTDDRSIIWTSDNHNIATVENGVIKAVSTGSTRITATVGNKSASVLVNVYLPSTGLQLNTGDFTLNKGENKAITASLLPEGTTDSANITWSSSNTSVASVNNGVVTALGTGITTIKATATIGQKNYEKSITVTVNPSTISRLGGNNRYETAGLINNKMKSDTIILVTGKNFADALSATALIKYHNAEIHLVNTELHTDTMSSLNNGEFRKAIIVGGTSVVSQSVENTVKNILGNNNVQRIGGSTRYETSSLVASSISNLISSGSERYPYAFAVTGKNFADALSVAPIAAMTGSPIVLTEGSSITNEGSSALINATKGFYKVGGQTAIGNGIDNIIGSNYKRLAGSNRYDTNKLVINEFKNLFIGNTIYLATGLDFPDSLAGSALAGKNNSPIVFVNKTVDQSTKQLVDGLNKANLTALGGNTVVSDYILNELNK